MKKAIEARKESEKTEDEETDEIEIRQNEPGYEKIEEGKKEKKKKEIEAVVNIYTSFNNTLVHVTDMSGKTIAKVTGGMVTKH